MTIEPVIVAIPQDAAPRTPQQVRRQRAAARIALRECARRCGAPRDGWTKDAHDAPLPLRGYYWSVAHKRRWAAAVISRQPVGIDIEEIVVRPRTLHDELAGDDEWQIVGDRSWHSFYRLWTAKEATLKANGVGIGELLRCRLIALHNDGQVMLEYQQSNWRVEHHERASYIAAVTCNGVGVRWREHDVLASDPSHARDLEIQHQR